MQNLIEGEIKARSENDLPDELIRENNPLGHELKKHFAQEVAKLKPIFDQIEAYDGHDAEKEKDIVLEIPIKVKFVNNGKSEEDIRAVFLDGSGIDILPWIEENDINNKYDDRLDIKIANALRFQI